jgi:glycosyltransferase involved in cell wall biosynthesis
MRPTSSTEPARVQGHDASLRFVGASRGDPYDPVTASGMARFLFDALERRYRMVGRVDVELRGWPRRLAALAAFHPSRPRWRQRFYKSWLTFTLQSRNCRRRLNEIREPYDLVVQVSALFQTTGARTVLYIDNTNRLSEQAWLEWTTGRTLPVGPSRDELERRVYLGAEHVFAMGTHVAASVVEHYGVPANRVSAVGGGANLDRLPGPRHHAGEPTVLFVGREFSRKGGERLLEAFRQVRARAPAARLQIVGPADVSEEPGVEVLGRVDDRERLAELYLNARVFCLPSRFEPYGLVVLEAMAYGLPCVVTSVGALPDIVEDGRTGHVVAAGDGEALTAQLLRFIEEPDYAARLGAAGKQRFESHFTWDSVVERMAPVLDALGADQRLRAAR